MSAIGSKADIADEHTMSANDPSRHYIVCSSFDQCLPPIAVPRAFTALAESLLRRLRQARRGSCPSTRVRPPPDSHAGGRSKRCQGSKECWARDAAARQAPLALASLRAVLRPLKESRTGEA